MKVGNSIFTGLLKLRAALTLCFPYNICVKYLRLFYTALFYTPPLPQRRLLIRFTQKPLFSNSPSTKPAFIHIGTAAFLMLYLTSCASTSSPPNTPQLKENRIAELQIVDCLLPGTVRRLGNTEFLTPRRAIETTAVNCQIRGGEYTAFDRANYKTALNIQP